MAPNESEHDRAREQPASAEPAAPECRGDLTLILSRIEQGEPHAAEELLPLVYEELRKLAAAKMAHENPGQTLQATALVHEAYIRLVDRELAQHWNSRRHFFAAAGEAMRRILVENARRKQELKRGGQMTRHDLGEVDIPCAEPRYDTLALDEALTRLARRSPQVAKLVELRYFVGLSHDEAGRVLEVSDVTARRYWRYARAWLLRELSRQ